MTIVLLGTPNKYNWLITKCLIYIKIKSCRKKPCTVRWTDFLAAIVRDNFASRVFTLHAADWWWCWCVCVLVCVCVSVVTSKITAWKNAVRCLAETEERLAAPEVLCRNILSIVICQVIFFLFCIVSLEMCGMATCITYRSAAFLHGFCFLWYAVYNPGDLGLLECALPRHRVTLKYFFLKYHLRNFRMLVKSRD